MFFFYREAQMEQRRISMRQLISALCIAGHEDDMVLTIGTYSDDGNKHGYSVLLRTDDGKEKDVKIPMYKDDYVEKYGCKEANLIENFAIKVRSYDKDGDGFNEGPRMIYSDGKIPSDIWFTVNSGVVQCLKNYPSTDSFGDEHEDWEPLDNVMLCTGKKDKHGKDIYDQDIVRFGDDEIISVVRYDVEKAMFVIDDYGYAGRLMENGWDEDAGNFDVIDTNNFDSFHDLSDIEVIGNTYQNSEIINRK